MGAASPQVNRNNLPILDRRDAWNALGIFLFGLLLYVPTLLPGPLQGDSGEFQTLAYTVDHAHTTGYEVYVLLAKVFTYLPVGTVAYRVNLFSAVMGALTGALVYLAAKVVSRSRWASAAGALVLLVSGTFWSQAIIAEVYTAGSVFSAAILLLVLLWAKSNCLRCLLAAGILGGVGYGVHGSVILFAPAVAVLVLLYPRRLRSSLPYAFGGAFIGLALFLAAFAIVDARETTASAINTIYAPSISKWDLAPDQIDSFSDRFAYLVLARQWRSAMFVDPGSVVPNNLDRLWEFLRRDYGILFLFLLAGYAALLRRDIRLGLFFTTAVVGHLLYTLNYRIGDIYVFFIPLYLYLSVLLAEGAALLFRAAGRLGFFSLEWRRQVLGLAVLVIALAPAAPAAIAHLRDGEARWDFQWLPSNAELGEWYRSVRFNVQDLEPDAVVLLGWNDLYGYTYAAHVDLNQPGMQFIEAIPYSLKPGMAESLLEYLREQLEQGRPVYALEAYEDLQRGGMTLTRQPVGVQTMYRVELR